MPTEPVVFVVDDDPSLRTAVARLIQSVGLRARTFESAEAFLANVDPSMPGCLVLDVRMPGQGGLELYERLVATGRDIPVIFITGHADVPMAVRAMKAGAVDFLSKPFEDSELLGAASQALERDRRRWEARQRAPGAGGA